MVGQRQGGKCQVSVFNFHLQRRPWVGTGKTGTGTGKTGTGTPGAGQGWLVDGQATPRLQLATCSNSLPLTTGSSDGKAPALWRVGDQPGQPYQDGDVGVVDGEQLGGSCLRLSYPQWAGH